LFTLATTLPLAYATGIARDTLMIASLGVFALGEATLSPTLPAVIHDLAPERLRGRYNAIFNLSNQVGPVLAPSLAGLALGHGLGSTYLLALSGICLAAAVVALLLRRVTPAGADVGAPDDPGPDGDPAGEAPVGPSEPPEGAWVLCHAKTRDRRRSRASARVLARHSWTETGACGGRACRPVATFEVHALRVAAADSRESRETACCRISTLRTLPVTVIGNPSTTWTYRGIL
jgi:hypothetical protein